LSNDLWPTIWQTGDWDIYNQTAQQNDTQGRATFAMRHPVPDESMVAYLDTVDEQDGDVYEVIVNWKDANNFHFARLVCEQRASPFMEGTLSLWSVSGGVEGMLADKDIGEIEGTSRTIIAIISEAGFCASVTKNRMMALWEYPALIPEGYYAGMGAAQRPGIQVDNFAFEEHLETKVGCPYCWCKCDDHPVHKQLTATIVDATGRMAGEEGRTITLDWLTDAPYTTIQYAGQWFGENSDGCDLWRLILGCAINYTVDGFTMDSAGGCNTVPSQGVPLYPNEGSTCVPFFLRFGPFSVGASDLVCQCGTPDEWGNYEAGEYYIEVTE